MCRGGMSRASIRFPKFAHSKRSRTISLEVAYVPKGNFPIHFNVKGILGGENVAEISTKYHQGDLAPKELRLVRIVKDKY